MNPVKLNSEYITSRKVPTKPANRDDDSTEIKEFVYKNKWMRLSRGLSNVKQVINTSHSNDHNRY